MKYGEIDIKQNDNNRMFEKNVDEVNMRRISIKFETNESTPFPF